MDIISSRLSNQGIINRKFNSPHDVVSFLGAVQSQDYPAAKWSIGIRMDKSTDKIVESAFNSGEILRTHIMRPTWHFVSPSNIRWMLQLTAPRVKQLMGHYNRQLELTDEIFLKCNGVLTNALKGNKYLTRAELAEQLEKNKIPAHGQRLGHIVMNAELDGVLVSGPRRGKQFTYALLEERVPLVSSIDQEEALAKLALIYFTSHGPAQLKDFVWWSGLSVKDATNGLDSIKAKLSHEIVDGKIYWFSRDVQSLIQSSLPAFLVSVYDEYFIGYTDRQLILEDTYKENMASVGNALLTSLIFINGKVEGTWKRTIKENSIQIKLNLFRTLNSTEKNSLQTSIEQYGKFHKVNVEILK